MLIARIFVRYSLKTDPETAFIMVSSQRRTNDTIKPIFYVLYLKRFIIDAYKLETTSDEHGNYCYLN